jgi:hypothetical protein
MADQTSPNDHVLSFVDFQHEMGKKNFPLANALRVKLKILHKKAATTTKTRGEWKAALAAMRKG